MRTREKTKGKLAGIPRMAAVKRFRHYKTEYPQPVHRHDLKMDPDMRMLFAAFSSFKLNRREKEDPHAIDIYEKLEKRLRNLRTLNCSPDLIERFSLALGQFRTEDDFPYRAGIFMSALINLSQGEDHKLWTKDLDNIDFIVFKNRGKNIVVEGDVGNSFGNDMVSGSITLVGNAGDTAGMDILGGIIRVKGNVGIMVGNCMFNGTIIIEGNAGDLAGFEMNEGKIIVNGNAGHQIGERMGDPKDTPPEIHIKGDIGSIGRVIHGKIFHKGKLIVDK